MDINEGDGPRSFSTLSAAPEIVEMSASITSTGQGGKPIRIGQSVGSISSKSFSVASNGLDTLGPPGSGAYSSSQKMEWISRSHNRSMDKSPSPRRTQPCHENQRNPLI